MSSVCVNFQQFLANITSGSCDVGDGSYDVHISCFLAGTLLYSIYCPNCRYYI